MSRSGGAASAASKTPNTTRGISPLVVSVLAAAWLIFLDNFGFWRTFLLARPGTWAEQISAGVGLALLLVLLFAALIRPLASSRIGVGVLAVLLVISGGVAHYVDGWGVLVDRQLVRNIVETDAREVSELLSWSTLADLAVRGLLPAALLLTLRLRPVSAWRMVQHSIVLLGASGIVGLTLVGLSYGALATTFRNHRELRLQLVPSNYIKAVYSHVKGASPPPAKLTVVAPDAKRALAAGARPRVLVLMIGETARAANFSLGGYRRDTNRDLVGSGVIYFPRVVSCGTDTATSLPCMFSNIGARGFALSEARARENMLDVLMRAGVRVSWLENNSGCKGVCARVPTPPMPTAGDPALCAEGGCQDEILLGPLQQELARTREDALIVLHMMGSHGPSYFKRYPAPGPFQPTCDTNRIQQCNRDSLINTYDNSIAYTSKVIRRVLDATRASADRLDVAVLYVSDHGESLGENNIYLHGLPSMLAPREQQEVPMIGWLSESAARALAVSNDCLNAISGRPYSHDNLFHTVLGFHGVKTDAYHPYLDLFALARRASSCMRS